jgi:hypothetical protein
MAQGPQTNFYLPNNTHYFSYQFSVIQSQLLTRSVSLQHALFHPSFFNHLALGNPSLGLVFGRFGSTLGTNTLICCKRYDSDSPFDEFILNLVKLSNNLFIDCLQRGHFTFSVTTLAYSERINIINDIIKAIATA